MKERLQKIWKFLKAPPVWFLWTSWAVALVAISSALTCVFIGYTGWLSYVAYVIAALSLAYVVYTIASFAPKLKSSIMGALKKRAFTRDLTEDYTFRTLVFAVCSLTVNIGFVAFNTTFAILTSNLWYGCLAGYYFLLTLLRYGVFWWNKKAKRRAGGDEAEFARLQKRNYGLCGGALLALETAMSVAVTFMVLGRKATKYTEITAIVFATYSVYKISLAVWNVFKARKTQDWQIQSFRNIGLVDAAISLLSLQTTLVSTFSEDGRDMLAMNAATGAFVCLLTIGIGVVMIIQSRRKVK